MLCQYGQSPTSGRGGRQLLETLEKRRGGLTLPTRIPVVTEEDAVPEVTSYPPGAVNYFELMSPVPQQCVDFYRGLFGWDGVIDQMEGYTRMMQGGKAVASISIFLDEPTFWMTHISVADVAAAVLQAVNAGGTLVPPENQVWPAEMTGEWKQALVRDPAGAYFGLFQPGKRIGAQLVDDPGTMCWSDLRTSSIDSAKTYYSAVFGWGVHAYTVRGETITEWRLNGVSNRGGTTQFDPAWP